MRASKFSCNNIGELNILNKIYKIQISPKKVYSNVSKNKRSKVILLEKTSPNHYPVYVKFVKKINDEYSKSPERKITSYNSRPYNNFSFVNLPNRYRNSIHTEIRNSTRVNNNPSDTFNTNNRNINTNEYDVNKLKNSLQPSQQGNPVLINNDMRNNRFISISPSHSSQKDNLRKKSNENNKNIEIEVEENNEYNKNNNKLYNKYNNKHKMRFLLSKNYKGEKLIKGKYLTKSPVSMMSGLNRNMNKNNLKININNNFKKNIDNDKCNNTESNPGTISNITDINQYKLTNIRNTITRNQILNDTPMVPISTPYSIETANNIFLNNYEIKIKLEDLILIESRLNDILIALNKIGNELDINVINESVEFFSFYFNSSLQDKFPLFFNSENRIIIKSAFNLNLFLILIIYHLSLSPSMLIKVIILLRNIFKILKINLFLFIRKIEMYFGEQFCIKNDIYFKTFNAFLKENNLYDLREKEILDIINENCISITNDIEIILTFYQTIKSKYFSDFQDIYMSISKVSEQDINNYFNNNLCNNNIEEDIKKVEYDHTENINGNIENIENIENNDNNELEQKHEDDHYMDKIILSYKQNKKIPPFIKSKSIKKYTLVLDLEDTLISVKIDNEGTVLCKKRPGLVPFLSGIKPFYEIISFTKLSKDYSNTIIQEIEGNKKLFDYNFYREHCVLVGREFIKDISKIGRDMKKVIMVDDLEDNLSYYPNNGVLICPYNAEENEEDRVLFELKKLLILFFRLGYEDIRVAIKNYKKEIYNKITLGNEV